MRYSLLSRFKGTLLGMAVAEAYARDSLPQSAKAIASLSSLTLSSARQLINSSNIRSDNSADTLPPTDLDSALAIALPIALLTHESHAKLGEQLRLTDSTSAYWEATLAIGCIIHQSIAEKSPTAHFIPNLCQMMPEKCADLIESLKQVQSGLETWRSLAAIRRHQGDKELIFPVYSFLSTPEDYVLTVQRALRLHPHSASSCTLAGALSGAYNGFGGIPTSWRLHIDRQIEAEIEQLSVQLLASWSGVYQPHDRGKIETGANLTGSGYTTIAAPQVMSSRRFLS